HTGEGGGQRPPRPAAGLTPSPPDPLSHSGERGSQIGSPLAPLWERGLGGEGRQRLIRLADSPVRAYNPSPLARTAVRQTAQGKRTMKPRQAACALLLLSGLLPPVGAGCHSLRLFPPPADKTVKQEKDGGLTAPGKYTLRVSQFAFLSDFELKRDLP